MVEAHFRVLPHLCVLVHLQQVENSMNVGTAHSEVNPNTRVMNSRGMWLSYILGIGLLHIVLLSIPFVSVPVVWTLTNLLHNLVSHDSGAALRCDNGSV